MAGGGQGFGGQTGQGGQSGQASGVVGAPVPNTTAPSVSVPNTEGMSTINPAGGGLSGFSPVGGSGFEAANRTLAKPYMPPMGYGGMFGASPYYGGFGGMGGYGGYGMGMPFGGFGGMGGYGGYGMGMPFGGFGGMGGYGRYGGMGGYGNDRALLGMMGEDRQQLFQDTMARPTITRPYRTPGAGFRGPAPVPQVPTTLGMNPEGAGGVTQATGELDYPVNRAMRAGGITSLLKK